MNPVQERFIELRSRSSTKPVIYLEGRSSSNPLYSRSYSDCNGVALLSDRFAGLTHYDLSSSQPENYLNELINLMKMRGYHPTRAIVIGGDTQHLRRNLSVLEKRGIPLARIHADGWETVGRFTTETFKQLNQKRLKIGVKDLIVVPETGEVLLNILNTGEFKRLH